MSDPTTVDPVAVALKSAHCALQPFADRVFNDNGETTVTDTYALGVDDYAAAYYAHRKVERAMQAALAPHVAGGGEVEARHDEQCDGSWCEGAKTAAEMLDAHVDIGKMHPAARDKYLAAHKEIDRLIEVRCADIIASRKERRPSAKAAGAAPCAYREFLEAVIAAVQRDDVTPATALTGLSVKAQRILSALTPESPAPDGALPSRVGRGEDD